MACCKGDPTEMIKIGGGGGTRYSPQQMALQKQLIQGISSMLAKPTNAYKGPTTAAPDPMQLMAANIMMNYGQGRGYTAPSFMNAQPGAGAGTPFSPIDWNALGAGGGKGKSNRKYDQPRQDEWEKRRREHKGPQRGPHRGMEGDEGWMYQ